MWSLDAMAEALSAAIAAGEAALRREQAVHGLDALQEVEVHPLLADAVRTLDGRDGDEALTVLREQPYPHEWNRKTRRSVFTGAEILPEHRDRQRCDLVLIEPPGKRLDDRLIQQKAVKKRKKAAAGTLFEALAVVEAETLEPSSESRGTQAQQAVQPEDAFWLEVKVVAQHGLSDGVLGPNRSYSAELSRGPLADLSKLAADERIVHAASLVVLFTDTEATAKHDLSILLHKCLDRELPVSSPVLRHVPVLDRLGNSVCTVCLIGVRGW
ncbi:MAG: hypothetical protein K2Q20_05080 [Phycisphaerales bacterium]|nr:hypothetical protein [Phycisphaerales bacterium]